MTVVHLRRGRTSLVLDARGPGLPRVVHWGADLGPLSTDDLPALVDATVPPVAVAGQAGAAAPAGARLGQQGQHGRRVEAARHHRRDGGVDQGRQVVGGQRAEVGAPVHDPGQPRAARVEHQAGPPPAQVDDGRNRHGSSLPGMFSGPGSR